MATGFLPERSPFPVQRCERVYAERLQQLQRILQTSGVPASTKYWKAQNMMDEWDYSDMEGDPKERDRKGKGAAGQHEPFAMPAAGASQTSPLVMGEPGVKDMAVLSEGQKRMIEVNKQLAMAKKKAKQEEAAVFAAMQWLP